VPAGRVDDDLPTLVARLGEDVLGLLDSKLGLIKLDVEQEVRGYGRVLLTQALAAAVVAVGVALGAAGVAFALAWLLPSALDPLLGKALAFGAVGLVGIGGGLLVLRRGAPDDSVAGAPHD
jgi:hypothetical protein